MADWTLERFITAYHGGAQLRDGHFQDRFLGMGEGYSSPPLGPGFYFHTDPEVAARYCKYVKRGEPALTEVVIGPTDLRPCPLARSHASRTAALLCCIMGAFFAHCARGLTIAVRTRSMPSCLACIIIATSGALRAGVLPTIAAWTARRILVATRMGAGVTAAP